MYFGKITVAFNKDFFFGINNMDDQKISHFSLIISIIGIIILYIISLNIEPSTVNDLRYEDIGKIRKIEGKVNDVKNYDKLAILKISTENEIDVLLFKDSNVTIEKGIKVEIEGEVKESEYGYDLIAHRIDKSDNK
jgi:divalent metal cation (Fe/Co/Zn/Cd) transporter